MNKYKSVKQGKKMKMNKNKNKEGVFPKMKAEHAR